MTGTPLRKQQSNIWERDPDDYYVEPGWVSSRLFEVERFRGNVHDPAAGSGRILEAASFDMLGTTGGDIVVRTTKFGIQKRDWLKHDNQYYDNIVSNPPFALCDVGHGKTQTHPFVDCCLTRAISKVALLLPTRWIQGEYRSRWLETTPLYRVWVISPRPSMPPGAVIEAGVDPGGGKVDFAWFVWLIGFEGEPTIKWLRRDK